MKNTQLLSVAVGLACFLWMLNFLGITPFFPFIAEDLNTTVALLGQITGLVALVSVPIGMLTGPLADRYGHRKVLLLGVGALSIGSLVLQRRINWRGDSCEEIEPATAPLRSSHDR